MCCLQLVRLEHLVDESSGEMRKNTRRTWSPRPVDSANASSGVPSVMVSPGRYVALSHFAISARRGRRSDSSGPSHRQCPASPPHQPSFTTSVPSLCSCDVIRYDKHCPSRLTAAKHRHTLSATSCPKLRPHFRSCPRCQYPHLDIDSDTPWTPD